jgi:hypothetical protein
MCIGGIMVKINPKGRKHHDTILREKFGIGLYQYETMFEQQQGKCFICSNEEQEKNLAVDHCHSTGRVRGLLCGPCNQAIGLMKDSPALLIKAAQYLEMEFSVPEDKEIKTKPHSERARWRNKVITPDGIFSSLTEAGAYYKVHPTTVGYWTGSYKKSKHLKKDGFEMKKVFDK